MKYSDVFLSDLQTTTQCRDAIDAIENNYRNYHGGLKAWNACGKQVMLTSAEKKIDAIRRKLHRLEQIEIKAELLAEFNDMALMPIMEMQTVEGEFLLVDLSATLEGLFFELDTDGKPTSFDGDVIDQGNDVYLLPWDTYFTLDEHFASIHDNINEGFLIPNNLLPREETQW